MRLCALVLIGFFTAFSSAAASIVIRHDVLDAAYISHEGAYPSVFGIYRNEVGHKRCIATLVASRWALTAAHCIHPERLKKPASPRGPGYVVEIAGIEAVVDRVVEHPKLATGGTPDLALLRLRSPVKHVAPISLYRDRDEVGRVVLIPGWGGTGDGAKGERTEDGLFRVAENRVDRVDGHRIVWKFDDPRNSHRALTLEGISGGGDSGGPAFIMTCSGLTLAGISSSQIGNGVGPGKYGVEEAFVRVSDFTGWIDRVASPTRSKSC